MGGPPSRDGAVVVSFSGGTPETPLFLCCELRVVLFQPLSCMIFQGFGAGDDKPVEDPLANVRVNQFIRLELVSQ